MVAVELGLVSLDDNVRELVPELRDVKVLKGFKDGESPRTPILEDSKTPITLRQLLSHQSGFAYDQLNGDLQEWSKYNKRTDWTMTGSMVSTSFDREGNLLICLGWLHTPAHFRARLRLGIWLRHGLGWSGGKSMFLLNMKYLRL